MIVVLKGGFDPPRIRRVQRQVREDVMPTELGPTVQARKEGRFALTLEPRLMDDGTTRLIKTGEAMVGPDNVYISPLLGDLTLADLPDNLSFGNGASGPFPVRINRTLPGGAVVSRTEQVVWFVFPYGTQLTAAQLDRMREIREGIPPGSPERNVFRPFTQDGALSRQNALALRAALQAKPRTALKLHEIRWLDIELPKLTGV